MLSTEDIKKITEAQIEAQKELFYTKIELDEKFSNLQNSIDSVYKDKVTDEQEQVVTKRRIKDLEDFVDEAAPKLGIKYQH